MLRENCTWKLILGVFIMSFDKTIIQEIRYSIDNIEDNPDIYEDETENELEQREYIIAKIETGNKSLTKRQKEIVSEILDDYMERRDIDPTEPIKKFMIDYKLVKKADERLSVKSSGVSVYKGYWFIYKGARYEPAL
jgi:hypothetical protein